MSRFPIEINQNSFENRTHHRTFKRVKLNFQCNQVPIELNLKRYSFFKRFSFFQTSLTFSKRVSFFERRHIFKRVSFQTSLIVFLNESHVFKWVSCFQTSLVFKSSPISNEYRVWILTRRFLSSPTSLVYQKPWVIRKNFVLHFSDIQQQRGK